MSVKLIAVTSSKTKSAEELIAFTARVSNPSNQNNMETAPKLIKYLIKNAHWSPFEMASMTVEIETSRAIAAQILRHRSFSFQEFSQRYAEATEFITYPARRQDDKNRQNSIDDLDAETMEWFNEAQKLVQEYAFDHYLDAIEKGVAKEQARFLLPLSTKTTLYMTGTVRSWIHYIQLRTAPGTQLEHREIALDVKDVFKQYFPAIAEALEW